ncbi:alpha-amylase family glycosyl hydrolase [uncultured Polaribacter sp.]|uniref:alpha-amylase family glycosyl hydrolase n=1 Tax=uncultured Polaribacter sp. TaxID=174711 RepID=UPI00261EC419|nr:alpha-amylase family glycosyl hydrolase [uncultured Polaribacter sp.]
MKQLLSIFLMAICVFSCTKEKKEVLQEATKKITPISKSDIETAVIYEANIRQYSPEGTFEEFTKDIPEIKKLGVKIIWLMPVFPISETKRKATGGADSKFASEFPKEEQSKYLGSYYAVSDFTKINPEFGTIKDFRALIKTAHKNGIYVILDWVPNHTGWDHTWLKTNSDFYTKNDKGEVIHPEDTDWTDVADLNYNNKELQEAMISDMKYWISKEGVDGFRCDVAGSVPTSFWQNAIPKLRAEKDIFMLAEAWEPELLKENLFDMGYAWDGHHLLNGLAKGEKTAEDLKNYIHKTYNERYEKDAILMNFVTNHDENSWNGTIKERMGDKAEMLTALSYIIPGMPLIYSGQEYDLNHRLKFFEKDAIPKTKGITFNLLEKLGTLKNTNAALHGGKEKAAFEILESEKDIFILKRKKGDETVLFIANFSNEKNKIGISENGVFENFLTNEKVTLHGDAFEIEASAYKIFVK